MHKRPPCERKKLYRRGTKLRIWSLNDEKGKFEIYGRVWDHNHVLFQHGEWKKCEMVSDEVRKRSDKDGTIYLFHTEAGTAGQSKVVAT